MLEPLAGFDEKRAAIAPLVDILKTLDHPNSHAMDLLEAICEKYPSTNPTLPFPTYIQISCPHHTTHSVSSECFQLLEEVELALGSALQEIISIEFLNLRGPLMATLASRVSRQGGKMNKVTLRYADCSTKRSAEDLSTLLCKCEAGEVKLEQLYIEGNIESDGWAALGKAFPSGLVRPDVVQVRDRMFMTEGRREDIRSVWDSVARFWILDFGGDQWRLLPKLEEGWKALEDILDGSELEESGDVPY